MISPAAPKKAVGLLLYGPQVHRHSPQTMQAAAKKFHLPGWFRGRRQNGQRSRPVYGANIAAQGLIKGILEQGSFERYEVFTPPHLLALVAKSLPAGDGRVCLHGFPSLITTSEPHPVYAWFTPWPEFAILAYLRSLSPGNFAPITVTHYSLSYQRSLHHMILPILLSESLPCDSIVCTGPAARQALQKLLDSTAYEFNCEYGVQLRYRGRLDVIAIGVDIELFRPREKRTARKELGLPVDACILLFFGRLSFTDKADLFPLLTAFKSIADLPENRQELLLVVAGTPRGGYAENLRNWIRDLELQNKVRLVLEPKQPHLLYSAADIFVSPVDSVQESFGISILEAMASGVPQVASDWNGYRETVEHGKTGFVVPTYWGRCDSDICLTSPLLGGQWESDHALLGQSVAIDIRLLREYLSALIKNRELREKMAAKSRERAVAEYSWEVVVNRYESLWKELHLVAVGQSLKHPKSLFYTRPAYFDVFNHYATRLLDDNAGLRLSPIGWDLREQSMLLSLHPAVRGGFLSPLCLQGLLDNLISPEPGFDPHNDSKSMTVGELIKLTRLGNPGCNDDMARRHILWLLKQGYLECAG